MLQFNWYHFNELSNDALYHILALRSAIFVVEQQCLYQDLDYQDQHALHLLGTVNDELVAYLRLFPPQASYPFLQFGRVFALTKMRGQGYGKALINEMLRFSTTQYPNYPIHCSAQFHLQKFYESFGLRAYGDAYDEDGILHIDMKMQF